MLRTEALSVLLLGTALGSGIALAATSALGGRVALRPRPVTAATDKERTGPARSDRAGKE